MTHSDTELHNNILNATGVFRALAHPIRLDIIITLASFDMSVNSLAETLELPQPKLSKHLAILSQADLIQMKAQGRSHIFSLKNPELISSLIDLISDRL